MGADNPVDSEVQKKQTEAAIAEAEARIAKAKKEIAEAEKAAADAKDNLLLEATKNKAIADAAKSAAEAEKAAAEANDKDVRDANRNKTIAEAEKAAAEAEKATLAAQLPSSTSKGLEGKIELDDKAGYFSDLLAYRSLQCAAADIAKTVAGNLKEVAGNHTGDEKIKKIILTTRSDWHQIGTQLADVTQRFATFESFFSELLTYQIESNRVERPTVEAVPLAALAAAPAVLGVIADVAAFFRKDRTIKGRAIALNQTALLAEVAQNLGKQGAVSVLPSLKLDAESEVLKQFNQLRSKDDLARRKRFEIERLLPKLLTEITTQESQLKSKQDKITALPKGQTPDPKDLKEVESSQQTLAAAKQRKEDAERIKGYFDSVINPFAEFASKLSVVPEGGSASPLASLSEASVMLGQQNLLFVSVVSQGGEYEARKSIWTSGKMYHRAGIVCTYILFRPNGEIASSGSVERDLHAKEGEVYYSYPSTR